MAKKTTALLYAALIVAAAALPAMAGQAQNSNPGDFNPDPRGAGCSVLDPRDCRAPATGGGFNPLDPRGPRGLGCSPLDPRDCGEF
jgi:hypothetical protein